MAQKKATLLLQLKDQTSKALGTLGGRLDKFRARLNKSKLILAAIAAGIGFFAKQCIDAADKIEQWSISFETMTGSASEAKRIMEDLRKFAAETPFELPGVIESAKNLMAFGIESDKIIPTLKSLGDVAAGLSIPVERLVLNFGQIKTQAKLTGRELMDFSRMGVPLIAELAKNLNVAEAEIAEMVSKGKIGFEEVEEAFASMSGAGGKFENLMSKQMETMTGLTSNLKDKFFDLKTTLGEELLPVAKQVVKDFIKGMENLIKYVSEHRVGIGKTINYVLYWGTTTIQVIDSIIESIKTLVNAFSGLAQSFYLDEGRLRINFGKLKDTLVDTFTSGKESFIELLIDVDNAYQRMVEKNLELVANDKLTKEQLEIQETEHRAKVEAERASAEAKRKAYELKQQKEDEDKRKKKEKKEKEAREKEVATLRKQQDLKWQVTSDWLGTIAEMATSHDKRLAGIGRTVAVAGAIVDTHRAGVKALATTIPPWNYILMAQTIAQGMMQVAKMRAVKFAEGGIVLPRAGGTPAVLGEAGRAEAVIPLDSEAGEMMRNEVHIHIEAGTIIADDTSIKEFARKIDEKLFELRHNNESTAFSTYEHRQK